MSEAAAELLERWRAGDLAAGDTLIDLVYPRLARFFRNKVVCVPDDDDLTQQAMAALVETKERLTQPSSFWALVFKIARNILNEYIRKKYKRSREEDDFEAVCVRDLDRRAASSLAVRGLELRAFVDSLRGVPLRDQILLELRYFEGFTAREIGDLLELPRGSVHRQLESSVQRLRELVAEHLGSPGLPAPAPSADELDVWACSVRARLQ